MTEEGRRLTIERIDKYKEEVDKKEKEIKEYTFYAGACALFAFSGIIKNFGSFDSTNISRLLNMFISNHFVVGLYAFSSVNSLIHAIKAISRKTGIEIKIEDLEAQLRLDEIEEKGKSI